MSNPSLPTLMVVDSDPLAIEVIRDRYSESYQMMFAQSVDSACEQMATNGDVDAIMVTVNDHNNNHASLMRLSRCAGLRPVVLLLGFPPGPDAYEPPPGVNAYGIVHKCDYPDKLAMLLATAMSSIRPAAAKTKSQEG
ncbi:MAG: hypothetical protein NTW07_07250 [candidate division Zixibacteria bacterium]|nr:hypothetical protein [candidate division Zixibacteria bacterium]